MKKLLALSLVALLAVALVQASGIWYCYALRLGASLLPVTASTYQVYLGSHLVDGEIAADQLAACPLWLQPRAIGGE